MAAPMAQLAALSLLLASAPLPALGRSGRREAESATVAPSVPQGPVYPWAGKNGDRLRTGASAFVAPRNLSAGPTWSFHEVDVVQTGLRRLISEDGKVTVNSLGRAAPLIDDEGSIYYSTVSTGNVYKFLKNGTSAWSFNAHIGIPSIGALMDGRLFVGTAGGETIALDMRTGQVVWRRQVTKRTAPDTWSVTAADGVVLTAGNSGQKGFLAMNNDCLVALRAADGGELWRFETPGDIYNVLVAIKDGSAVFSTSAGKVLRLDLQTGRVFWETELPQHPGFSTGGTVIGPNGVVYSTWNEERQVGFLKTKQEGIVAATDFETGRSLWKTSVGYAANNAPSVGRLADGRLGVVVALGDNPAIPAPALGIADGKGKAMRQRVEALDPDSGAVRWKLDLPDWHGSALGDEQRVDICLPDAFGNAAIAGDGAVYLGHASGLLYGIRDANGDGEISPAEVQTWQAGAAFQGTPALAPGILAATPCDGLHVWLDHP